MTCRDIIRRAFRATGVGIDIDGIMKNHIKFPNFATYVPPEKDEEHNDDLLTKAEIDLLVAQEKSSRKTVRKNARMKERLLFARVQKNVQGKFEILQNSLIISLFSFMNRKNL